MSENGSLGLYLTPKKAVAVWLSSGPELSVQHQTVIPLSEEEPETMALQAARAVQRAGFAYDEAFVAIHCSYYTQYSLQSEFEDYHQIESTIKYDAEEAATTDATNLAVAFEVSGKTEHGTEVTAFTSDRQLMTDILLDLQEGGMDPAFMEPDSVCLLRALDRLSDVSSHGDTIYVVLGQSDCYLFRPKSDYAPVVRTFFVAEGHDVTASLTREILLTGATGTSDDALASVVLIGKTENVDAELLTQSTGLEVRVESTIEKLDPSWTPDGAVSVHEEVIAYGTALAVGTRSQKVDFRRDFMPYQGRKKILENSLRLISISMAVLLLAVAVFFQLKTFRMKGYVNELKDVALVEHRAVAFGKKPLRGQSVNSSLRREYRRAVTMAAGTVNEGVVIAKLTFLFEAINKTPKNVDIKIQQINTTERSMKVKGDTNGRNGTKAFFEQIKKHPQLKLNQQQLRTNNNRDAFEITIDPAK